MGLLDIDDEDEISQANKLLLLEYLDFIAHRSMLSKSTYTTYQKILSEWMQWCNTKQRIKFLAVTNQHISAYNQFFLDHQRGDVQRTLCLRVLKIFYKWLFNEEYIEKIPWPKGLKVNTILPDVKVVLDAETIFKLRRKLLQGKVERAAYLECLLSSGLRRAEFSQLHVRDIKFGPCPTAIDVETQQPSSAVGAYTYLEPAIGTIKRRKPRFVYFSPLAAKLLRLHIRKFNLTKDTPLFPWAVNTMFEWMSDLGRGVVRNSPTVNEAGVRREAGFQHLQNVESLPISAKFKKMIKARQKQEQAAQARNKVPDSVLNHTYVRKGKTKFLLHPHACRDTFTALMYHKNYHGRKHDYVMLKEYLGHGDMRTVNIYLTQVIVCRHDADWKRIMFGSPMDYLGVK